MNLKIAFYFLDDAIVHEDKCFTDTAVSIIIAGLSVEFSCNFERIFREMNKDYFSSTIPFRVLAIGAPTTEMCYHLLFFSCKNKLKNTSSLEFILEDSTDFVD